MTTGIYIPYTFESNINVDVPAFSIPAIMCHELTHFRGFMRENEANFLGYLACMESPRDDFRYSGAMMAFFLLLSAAVQGGQRACRLGGGNCVGRRDERPCI